MRFSAPTPHADSAMSTPSAPRSRSRSRSNDGAVGRLRPAASGGGRSRSRSNDGAVGRSRPAASGGGSDIPEAVAGYILDSWSKVIQSQPTTTRDSHSQTNECHTLELHDITAYGLRRIASTLGCGAAARTMIKQDLVMAIQCGTAQDLVMDIRCGTAPDLVMAIRCGTAGRSRPADSGGGSGISEDATGHDVWFIHYFKILSRIQMQLQALRSSQQAPAGIEILHTVREIQMELHNLTDMTGSLERVALAVLSD